MAGDQAKFEAPSVEDPGYRGASDALARGDRNPACSCCATRAIDPVVQSGFSANSVAHLTVMGHPLSRWMSGNGLELEDLCAVRIDGVLRVPAGRRSKAVRGEHPRLRHQLDRLTAEGVVPPTCLPGPATPLEAPLAR
jgi:hypothetical protein